MIKKLLGKKAIVTIIGILAAVLSAYGLDLPEDVKSDLLGVIMWIVGLFNGSQGLCDVATRGKTSASASFNNED